MENTSQLILREALKDFSIPMEKALEHLDEMGYTVEPSPNTQIDMEIYNVLQHQFGRKTNLQETFEKSLNKVVAIRGGKKDYTMGFPRPLQFFENEVKTRGLVREERENLFKNSGSIIVKKEFYNIWDKFEDTEFFTLEYEEDKAFIPHSRASVKYCSLHNDASSCKKLPLIIPENIYQVLEEGFIDLPYSHHMFVFVKHDSQIFGPISVQQVINHNEDEYEVKEKYRYAIQPLPINFFNLDQNYENVIFEFHEDDIQDYIIFNNYGKNNALEHYISNIQHLVANINSTSFLLNEKDEDIIGLVNRQIPENYKGSKEDWVNSYAADNPITRKRFKKYLELKTKSENWLSFMEEYISSNFLQTPQGKQEIENYIKKHENIILDDFREEIEAKIKEELQEENDKLKDAREEKERLRKEIEVLQNESQLIKSKSEELISIEAKLEEATEKLSIANKIEDLRQKEEKQDGLLAEAINKVQKYKEQLQELRDQYSSESEASMHKKLLDLKPYVDALNGFSPNNGKSETVENFQSRPFYQEEKFTLKMILEDVNDFLQKNQRMVKTEETLNYITNLQQNFLTIFSGMPGVGKTSLATLLSQFFTASTTFCNIPVSRGWNSRKNLLGYYNPINECYQHDEYGFIRLLRWYNFNDDAQDVPAMILLDESNLSPMEHYWSDFISISDRQGNDRFVTVEDKTNLSIPNGLRFISTINSDHTTELLSPRLIDRAAIVKIPYQRPSEDGIEMFHRESESYLPEMIYNQKHLDGIFRPLNPELNRNEQKIFFEILNVLNDDKSDFGKPVPISPRKIKLIYNYCHTTRDLFFEITGNQLLNLDFSILQHVLPLINGQGTKYENRLKGLREVLEEKGLMRSLKELNHILAKGQDYKNFSFF